MTAQTDLSALRLVAPEIERGLATALTALEGLDSPERARLCERELHRLRGAFGIAGAPGLARFAEGIGIRSVRPRHSTPNSATLRP